METHLDDILNVKIVEKPIKSPQKVIIEEIVNLQRIDFIVKILAFIFKFILFHI